MDARDCAGRGVRFLKDDAMTDPAPDDDRRYQPDRRKLDQDTIAFRTSVYGQLEEMKDDLHSGDERFKSIESHIAELRQDLAANSVVTAETATSLAALNGVVNKIKESIDAVADFMNAMTGGMKALEGIARVARAVGAIAMAAGALLAIVWAWPKK
jgi:hypothetical protein